VSQRVLVAIVAVLAIMLARCIRAEWRDADPWDSRI
jgi:hypothetical protein